jgi:hypothetical protein
MEGSDTPISLGLLIDKSLSMRLPLYVEGKQPVPAAILAANRIGRAVVKLMKPQDEFLLMTFDEKLQVRQNFTQDRKKIEDQLQKLNEVGNATHLYENVVNALEKMKKAKYKRRALLVITDAYDTSGKNLKICGPKSPNRRSRFLRAEFARYPKSCRIRMRSLYFSWFCVCSLSIREVSPSLSIFPSFRPPSASKRSSRSPRS